MKLNRITSFIFLEIICVFCAIFVLRHCFFMERRFDRLNRMFSVETQRNITPPGILHPIASDGYLWIRHTKDMIRNSEWRLNYTRFDNAPYGRNVHWHSGFAWWLMGVGWLYHVIQCVPLNQAIERSAVWANSIILIIGIFLLPVIVNRRLGARATIALLMGMVSCGEFYENFIPAYPDHHGVISLTALFSIIFLLLSGAGWIRGEVGGYARKLFPRDIKEARFWIIGAAFFSAAALWVSTVSQILLMAGLGIGVLLNIFIFSKRAQAEGVQYYPHLWALWGRFGAGFSILFYLLEYFPDKMGMQLLSNHSLYALIWLGIGETLAVLTRLWYEKRKPLKIETYRLIISGVIFISYPLIIFAGNPAWWSLRDPFLVALHKDIMEFEPLFSRLKAGSINLWGWLWSQLFYFLPGIVILFIRPVSAACRALILFILGPAFVFSFLSFYQVRWSTHYGSVFIVLLSIVTYILLSHLGIRGSKGKKTAWYIFIAIIIILAISPIKKLSRAYDISTYKKDNAEPWRRTRLIDKRHCIRNKKTY